MDVNLIAAGILAATIAIAGLWLNIEGRRHAPPQTEDELDEERDRRVW